MKITDKQIDFIQNEISITYEQIDRQRKSTTDFLKVYFSIILALFGYIYFIENRLVINNVRTDLPSKEYFIFGLFGVILTLLVFIIGWSLLDNITKAIYKSIKHYKHISNMRYIVSETYEEGIFKKYSILPLNRKNIPVRISAQVPVIGSFINFILLFLITYFLGLFLPFSVSLLMTTFTMTILSVFYSNQLEKHFEELLIAQKLTPQTSEKKVKERIDDFVKIKKKNVNYIKTKKWYVASLIVFSVATLILLVYLQYEETDLFILFIPLVLFLITLIPRTYMGLHRVQELSCFKDGNTKYNNV